MTIKLNAARAEMRDNIPWLKTMKEDVVALTAFIIKCTVEKTPVAGFMAANQFMNDVKNGKYRKPVQYEQGGVIHPNYNQMRGAAWNSQAERDWEQPSNITLTPDVIRKDYKRLWEHMSSQEGQAEINRRNREIDIANEKAAKAALEKLKAYHNGSTKI